MMSACVRVRLTLHACGGQQVPALAFHLARDRSLLFPCACREFPVSASHLPIGALWLQIPTTTLGIYVGSGDIWTQILMYELQVISLALVCIPLSKYYHILLLDYISHTQLDWALWVPEFRISCYLAICSSIFNIWTPRTNEWWMMHNTLEKLVVLPGYSKRILLWYLTWLRFRRLYV